MDEKQEIVLNLIKEGKSIKEASKEAKTLEIIVKRWIQLGEDGDERYSQFYKEYTKITNDKEDELYSNKELIDMAIKLLEDNKTLQEVTEILKIPTFKTNNWYYQGKLGIEPYDKFYNTCLKFNIDLSSEEKRKIETFKGKELRKKLNNLDSDEIEYILKSNEIENISTDYKINIETINKTLTLKEIEVSINNIDKIKEKRHEIHKILKKSRFRTLLNLLEEQDRQKYKNSSRNHIINRIMKRLKLNECDEFLDLLYKNFNIEEEPDGNETRKCKICGKKLSENEEDKCKKCRKKANTAKILIELLNSVSPEVPFYSDDLKNLGYDKATINHYIWSLQDYDLIVKEKNNKYSLISKEKLDEFIKKYGEGSTHIETENKIRLSKKCRICEKNLAIAKFVPDEESEDGYGDICKKCKKHVKAANYIKYILKWKNTEEPFLKEDIEEKYNNPKSLTAHIWTLQDLDLIDYNEETEEYSLKNQTIIDKFLENYFIEEEYEKVEKNLQKKEEDENKQKLDDFVGKAEEYEEKHYRKTTYNKNGLINKKMNLLINSLISGKSLEDACAESNLTDSIIKSWIRFAKQGNSEYLKFYEDYLAVTTHEVLKDGQTEEEADEEEMNNIIYSLGYTPEKHNTIIETIKDGKSINEASKLVNIHINDLIKWYKNGKNGVKPFDSYYSDYNNARKYYEEKIESKRPTRFDEDETQEKINIFIEAIREGKTRTEASELSGIKISTFDLWISKGNKGEEKYIELVNNYKKAREVAANNVKKLIEKEEELKEFLNYIKEGKTCIEACELSNLELKLVQNWIKQGKLGKEEFVTLANEYEKAKEEGKTKKDDEKVTIYSNEEEGLKENIFKNIKLILVEKNNDIVEIFLKGKIHNMELMTIISGLKNFEKGIDKIITNRLNEDEFEILIELTINNEKFDILRKLIS